MNPPLTRPFTVVSFDLDQTLVFHSNLSRWETVLAMLSANGHPVTANDYQTAMRIAREFYNALGYHYAPDADRLRLDYIRLGPEYLGVHDPAVIDDIGSYYLAYERESKHFVCPTDACALLSELQASGLQLANISSNLDAQARAGYCGLRDYFTYILTPGLSQPKPELFRILLERTGLRPDQVLHIGDDPILDVLAARKRGIDGVEGDKVEDPESVHFGKRMRNGWKNSAPWTYSLDPELIWLPKAAELETLRKTLDL